METREFSPYKNYEQFESVPTEHIKGKEVIDPFELEFIAEESEEELLETPNPREQLERAE